MWSTVGHDAVVRSLQTSLHQGRASHAYLFVGPKGAGKAHLAFDLAQALNCTSADKPCGTCGPCKRIRGGRHADVQVIGVQPDRKLISIDQVAELQQSAGLQAYEGGTRVFIIDGADLLSQDASNRFLKTLEEPPDKVCLVLLAVNEETLPATMVSRCRLVHLRPVPREMIALHLENSQEVEPERARLLASFADGSIGWAVQAALDAKMVDDREVKIEQIVELARLPVHDRLVLSAGLAEDFSRKRDSVYAWLSLLGQFWRDVLLAQTGQDAAVINADRLDVLRSSGNGLTVGEIALAVRRSQETLEQLEKNINVRLALDVLMLDLPRVVEQSSLASSLKVLAQKGN